MNILFVAFFITIHMPTNVRAIKCRARSETLVTIVFLCFSYFSNFKVVSCFEIKILTLLTDERSCEGRLGQVKLGYTAY